MNTLYINRIERIERLQGIDVYKRQTVNTPREVSLGCGISVRFDPAQMARAQSLLRRTNPTTLIGLYDATRDERSVALKRVSTSSF